MNDKLIIMIGIIVSQKLDVRTTYQYQAITNRQDPITKYVLDDPKRKHTIGIIIK